KFRAELRRQLRAWLDREDRFRGRKENRRARSSPGSELAKDLLVVESAKHSPRRTRRSLSNHLSSFTPNPLIRVDTIDSAKLRAMRITAGSSSLKKLRGSLANSNSPRKTKF